MIASLVMFSRRLILYEAGRKSAWSDGDDGTAINGGCVRHICPNEIPSRRPHRAEKGGSVDVAIRPNIYIDARRLWNRGTTHKDGARQSDGELSDSG